MPAMRSRSEEGRSANSPPPPPAVGALVFRRVALSVVAATAVAVPPRLPCPLGLGWLLDAAAAESAPLPLLLPVLQCTTER